MTQALFEVWNFKFIWDVEFEQGSGIRSQEAREAQQFFRGHEALFAKQGT